MPVAAPLEVRDETVAINLPAEADVEVLAAYAPHSIDHGTWLPTAGLDDPRVWATWFIQELRLGWTPFGGRYGGGLLAGFAGEAPAAFLNFIPHRPGVVELCYGVAPHRRGRGLASRSARLAADWAISVGFQEVELHISDGHAESKRVAAKAGFREARRVTKHVRATGASYEDIVFIRAG